MKGPDPVRKVVLGMQVSLDGFVATVDGRLDWAFANFDDEYYAATLDQLRQLDTVLLGRVNYEGQAAHWPRETGTIAELMNQIQKVVFSSRQDTLEWTNARLATASPAGEIRRLRQTPGKHIGVSGGARFAQALSAQRLVDEYVLNIHPVALGGGLRLFADQTQLALVRSRALKSGVIVNHYRPGALAGIQS